MATNLVPQGEQTWQDQIQEIFSVGKLAGQDTEGVLAGVGANVANFLLIIAGIVVVTMVIYSGWQMITARGDESKIEAAKKQLLNALLATAVITLVFIIARLIINAIAKAP